MSEASIKKNYFFNLSYQVFSIIAPLITTPYISRVLGPNGVGTYSFAFSLVSYFTMIAVLGTGLYGQREVSYLQDDRRKRSAAFWNIASLRLLSSTLCLIAFLAFSLTQEDKTLYFMVSINIVAIMFDFSWLFQGMENFQSIAVRSMVARIIGIILIFLLVKNQSDLWIYAAILSGSTLLGNLLLIPTLRDYIDRPILRKIRPFTDFKTVLSLFIPTIAMTVYTVLDKTMIGVITQDAAQNGFYEQAIAISRTATMAVSSFGVVMMPRIGRHFIKGESEAVRKRMYQTYHLMWFVSVPICFELIAISQNFVPWFLGPDFMETIPILHVTGFLVIAIGLNSVTGPQYMIPTGRQNWYSLSIGIGTVLNFLLNLALIPVLQAFGAALTSMACEFVMAVIQLFVVRKELSVKTILKSSFRYLVPGICMFAVLMAVTPHLQPTIVNSLILISGGAIVYGAAATLMKAPMAVEAMRILKCKLRKS